MAPNAPAGDRITTSPARPIVSSRRTGPSPSIAISWCWRRALTNATRNSPTPKQITKIRVARAEDGMLAVATT